MSNLYAGKRIFSIFSWPFFHVGTFEVLSKSMKKILSCVRTTHRQHKQIFHRHKLLSFLWQKINDTVCTNSSDYFSMRHFSCIAAMKSLTLPCLHTVDSFECFPNWWRIFIVTEENTGPSCVVHAARQENFIGCGTCRLFPLRRQNTTRCRMRRRNSCDCRGWFSCDADVEQTAVTNI